MVTPVDVNYSAASGEDVYGGRSFEVSRLAVMAGDSLTAASFPSAGFRWGEPLARSPVTMVYNAGVPNDTLDDLWDRWQADVIDKLPNGGVIFLRIGTNSVGDASFNTKYQRFIDSVLASSILRMAMFALPPKQSLGSTIIGHNAFISGAVAQNPTKLSYIQDSAALGDGNYDYLAQYYVDAGVHMNGLGQYTQGLSMDSQIIDIYGAAPDPRVQTNDSLLVNPNSLQWVKNPLNEGSGTPDNWSVGANGAGTSVTGSIVAAEGGDENQTPWFRGDITGVGGTNHFVTFSTTLANLAITQPSEAPAKMRLTAEIRLNNLDMTNTSQLRIYAQQGGNVFIDGWAMESENTGIHDETLLLDWIQEIDSSKTYTADGIPLLIALKMAAADTAIGSLDIRCVSLTEVE